MKKASWKTTLGGTFAALGAVMIGSSDATLHFIGQVLAAIGPFLLGLAARDNSVTSEQAGAK